MILQDYVRLLRRGLHLLLLLVLVGGGLGYAVAALTPASYDARATVLVSVQSDGTPGGLQSGGVFAVQRASSYAGLATTTSVLDGAATALGDGTTALDLQEAVVVTARADSALIDIDAQAETAEGSAARANAVAAALADQAPELDAPVVTTPAAPAPAPVPASVVLLSTVQEAQAPTIATAPRPRNNIVAGAVAGLALGVLVLALRHAVDDRIRSSADVPRSRTLRVLAVLPRTSGRGTGSDPRSEALRRLRATITATGGPAGAGSSLAVTSVSETAAGDAREVVRGLAAAFAETGGAVLVVDLTGPSRPLGAISDGTDPSPDAEEGYPGSALLANPTAARSALVTGDHPGVSWLVPHDLGAGPAEVIGTTAGRRALEELSQQFSHSLLLCPPTLERSEAVLAASSAGATLLVAQTGRASRSQLQRAAGSLLAVQPSGVGVVLVGISRDEQRAE